MIFASNLDLFVEYGLYAAAITTGAYFAIVVLQRLGREFNSLRIKSS